MRWTPAAIASIALLTPMTLCGPAAGDEPDTDIAASRLSARLLSDAFKAAADAIEPSVVHITTVSERTVQRRDLFGRPLRPRSYRRQGLGSGVVVRADGLIVTNNHVIDGATSLIVRLADGTEHEATTLGTDPLRDLALLKIDAHDLTPARFAPSAGLDVGEWVLAVGSPFGFSSSFTAGIISATGRGLGIHNEDFRDYEDFIQTDAAINPGNSGGPLINLDGQVVGINTAIFTRTGGSVGLGFAIPSDLVGPVLRQLETRGRVDAGYVGISFRTGEDDTLVVDRVVPGGPAERAGLRAGDRLVTFNGRALDRDMTLLNSIRFTPPGSRALFEIDRDGSTRTLAVQVGSRVDMLRDLLDPEPMERLGMEGVALADRVTEITGLRGSGVLVLGVEPGSPADRAGIEPYDVVFGIGRLRVDNPGDLDDLAARVPPGQRVRVDLYRDGRERYAELVP
jgi:serine protease Do